MIADFERAYPNIKVETRSNILWEDMRKEVELAITQGDPPDVAHAHAFAYGAQGLAEPVDDLWQAWNAEQEFMPGAMEDVIWKERYYGVPLDINTLYNKRLFREAGLPEPSDTWTFDDLSNYASQLSKDDNSQYGFALTSSGWWMCGVINAAGGDLITERDGQILATLNDQQVRETFEWYRQLGLVDQVATLPPPIVRQSDHPVTLFRTGKVAMFFSGPFDLARLRREAPGMMDDVGTTVLPRGNGPIAGASVLGGGSLLVPKGAQHREAAFEFMKWMVAEPYAKRLALELGRYPVRTALYDDPDLQKDALLRPFFTQLKSARAYKLEAYDQANEVWKEAVRSLLDPALSVDEILTKAQAQAQEEIDEVEAASRSEPQVTPVAP
jgi:ABC-type glycerol-3-phosphate transport system substrate-binding protein